MRADRVLLDDAVAAVDQHDLHPAGQAMQLLHGKIAEQHHGCQDPDLVVMVQCELQVVAWRLVGVIPCAGLSAAEVLLAMEDAVEHAAPPEDELRGGVARGGLQRRRPGRVATAEVLVPEGRAVRRRADQLRHLDIRALGVVPQLGLHLAVEAGDEAQVVGLELGTRAERVDLAGGNYCLQLFRVELRKDRVAGKGALHTVAHQHLHQTVAENLVQHKSRQHQRLHRALRDQGGRLLVADEGLVAHEAERLDAQGLCVARLGDNRALV
mmetsp:Transcript_107981/g.311227  ORF Transcript_107981/g.311227 Transcript_107981/m.311227 type:complete len:268 (+) Transcript_107981:1324-2127(+)